MHEAKVRTVFCEFWREIHGSGPLPNCARLQGTQSWLCHLWTDQHGYDFLAGKSLLKCSLVPVTVGCSHEREQSCKDQSLHRLKPTPGGGGTQGKHGVWKQSHQDKWCHKAACDLGRHEGHGRRLVSSWGKQCAGGEWKSAEKVLRIFFWKVEDSRYTRSRGQGRGGN